MTVGRLIVAGWLLVCLGYLAEWRAHRLTRVPLELVTDYTRRNGHNHEHAQEGAAT